VHKTFDVETKVGAIMVKFSKGGKGKGKGKGSDY